MPSKPKAKPKRKAGLSQKQRFIEAARKAGADETGKTFERVLGRIVPARSASASKRSRGKSPGKV